MKATKRDGIARTCRTEVIVGAPVEAVWRPSRHGSPPRSGRGSGPSRRRQVVWLRGATQVAPGVRFRGRNRSGWLRWSRVCEVIAVQAPRELGWRTIATPLLPDSTEWRIALESVGGGTRIVQSYQVTRCPGWFPWVVVVVVRVNPAHIDRGGALGEDLRRSGVIAAGDARVVESAG